jgi:hypothetical protein
VVYGLTKVREKKIEKGLGSSTQSGWSKEAAEVT